MAEPAGTQLGREVVKVNDQSFVAELVGNLGVTAWEGSVDLVE